MHTDGSLGSQLWQGSGRNVSSSCRVESFCSHTGQKEMLQAWQYHRKKLLSDFDDQSALVACWMMCAYSTVYQICLSPGAGNTVLKMAVPKTIRQLV